MTGNDRRPPFARFIARVDAANTEIVSLRDVLSDLAGIDARLKQQLDRMEQTEKQISNALKVLQQIGKLRDATGFNGNVGASANADDNGRNSQQWQSALARLVFGDESGIG